ncbi:MAG: ATP-dependent DNA helicase RecQ, partial [Bacteroidetes bacterium]|nr:ATP-dependent DNA helicase RecQ [Bacteroidota bacterium]
AVLPTGAGKSLCYQLPALISENFSIVISPLIALMKDQVDNLNRENEVAAFINSTMDFIETEEVLQKISYGKIKLLYVAPERLDSKKFADRIVSLNPNFLFVDEAHCISEWGHNFRPSFAKISEFINYCSIKNVSAFTATATPEVVKDIGTQLNFNNPKIFVKGFERENLHLNVHLNVNKNRKCQELLSVIDGSAIIYTSSRKKAEEAAEFLKLKGFNCGYYHAGLNAIERRRVQEDFINDELRVICATNAFGMGIDKKDIRLIIHYNIPGSIENYYQEIGRAGRDNKDSHIHLLYVDNDINIQNYFISNSHPTKELIQNIYNAINDFNLIEIGNHPKHELIIDPDYISNYTGMPISRGLLHS